MLKSKFSFVSNVSSNMAVTNVYSSALPDTLFDLMKNNILLVNSTNETDMEDIEEITQDLQTRKE